MSDHPRLDLRDKVDDLPVRGEWKLVVFALLRFTGDDWCCFTSRPRLALLAGLVEQTVRDRLARLVELGGVLREERWKEDGSLTSPKWTIVPGRILEALVEADAEKPKREPPRRSITPPSVDHPRGDASSHPGMVDHPTPGVTGHPTPGVTDRRLLRDVDSGSSTPGSDSERGASPPGPPVPPKPKARKAKAIAPLAAELWALLRTPEDGLQPTERWSSAVMSATRGEGRTEQDARDYAAWMLQGLDGDAAFIRNGSEKRPGSSLAKTWPWMPEHMPSRLAVARRWAGRQRPAPPPEKPTWEALLDRAYAYNPLVPDYLAIEAFAAELAAEGGWPDLVPPEVAAEVAARARRSPPSLFDPHPPGAAP